VGTAALIVFLASLGVGLVCLLVLAYSGLLIYRTLRYAYKDSQPWAALFREYSESMAASTKVMEQRVRDIAASGREMRETVEDIQDALDEMRSHPLMRTARFVGRHR